MIAIYAADPWAFGWDAIVGIATGCLALFTAYLAWETRKLATTTKAEIDATFRPVVLLRSARELPVSVWGDRIEVDIVNVGAGPAISARLSLSPDSWFGDPASVGDGDADRLVGHYSNLSLGMGDSFTFTVGYDDLNGVAHYTSITCECMGTRDDDVENHYAVAIRDVTPTGTAFPNPTLRNFLKQITDAGPETSV